MAADTVPQIRIEWLQANLEFARKQLEVAQQYEHGATLPLQLVYAEKTAALAERELEEAVFLNKNSPSRISQLNVKRLRAKAEIAALRLKMWRSDKYVHSLIDQMQWQIDRLTEQIIDLNHRVGKKLLADAVEKQFSVIMWISAGINSEPTAALTRPANMIRSKAGESRWTA